MEPFKIIFSNYLINVGFTAWLSAQVLKTILVYMATEKFVPERLVGSGGMPSAHSALVVSIAVGMARKMGFSSPEFALAITLSGIVMYDAMGVRRAAGEQARVLNRMLQNIKEQTDNFWASFTVTDEIDTPLEEELEEAFGRTEERPAEKPEPGLDKEKALKEYLGHTPLEVLGGALLGILVAMILPPF